MPIDVSSQSAPGRHSLSRSILSAIDAKTSRTNLPGTRHPDWRSMSHNSRHASLRSGTAEG